MQAGRASTTAALVALFRAIASVEPELAQVCQDPVAQRLLPPGLARIGRLGARSPRAATALRWTSSGFVEHLALRTALIDRATETALAAGARQLVLLGAGLDARAFRLGSLAESTVFEVDHPATQRVKRKAVDAIAPCAARVRFAPCDFHDVSLSAALGSVGHDPAQPSVWIWEGVTMYLTPEAVDRSIAEIAALSAPGSTLIVSYVTPQLSRAGRAAGRIGHVALGLMSEPVLSPMDEVQVTARFAAHGWDKLADHGIGAAASAFGIRLSPLSGFMPDERVAVLRRA